MKNHKKIEDEGVEGDQSVAIAEVQHISQKEMKKRKKKSKGVEGDMDATMASDRERQEGKKEEEEEKSSIDIAGKEKKAKKKWKKEGKEWKIDEEAKGKKEEEEKSNIDIAGKEKAAKKKVKTADVTMFDADGRDVEKQKKKKKKDVFVGYEDDREVKSWKKEKRNHVMLCDDKEIKVEEKKEKEKEEEDAAAGSKGRKVERENEKKDDIKAHSKENKVEKEKEKKRKEKETEYMIAGHGEKKFKGRKENKKEKKRKEKETGDDMMAGHGEKKVKNRKENRKEKETEDDMMAGHGEKKVKDKKENKKKGKGGDAKGGLETIDGHSGNKAENLEAKRDPREKKKLDKDDKEGKANYEVPKNKKRASLADSSEHVTPESQSKKVRFSDEVEVFPLSNISTDSEKNKGNLVRGKRFSKEEDEMVKKAVSDYIETHQLGEVGLQMVLNCKSHRKLKGCWKEIGAALPWRPYVAVYYRAHILFEQGERKWTPEEVEIIRESYKKYGANWKKMAAELGKFRVHVKDAFRRYRLGNLNKGHWSQDEYQILFDLVNKDLQMKVFEEKKSKHGMLRDNICWEAISQKVGTRHNADCCTKWYQQLTSPMVAQGNWADVDDYRLLMMLYDLDASCEEEVDWDNLLEHRSGDLCCKRWQQMVRHLGEHGNKSFSEQVEVLSKRYCPDLLEVREALDGREVVD